MELHNLITCIDFEISSLCNAGCSVCMRRRHGHFSEFKQTYWTIDDVKSHIDLEIIKNLKNLILCGNFGDTMGNPDVVKIVKYFKENNPNLPIDINTNGGIGNAKDFEELAELGVHMVFGLDGMGSSNELYRVNVKWDKVLENLNAFISKCNPNQLEIQFIMWSETTDQIIPMIEFIQSIGFGRLFLRRPYTTGIKTEVYNMQGESTHFLTEIKNIELQKYLETFWNFEQLEKLKSDLLKIDLTPNPLELGNFLVKPKNIFPKKDYTYTEENFSYEEIQKLKSIEKQTCYSKNFMKPEDLVNNNYNIYITHDKLLMPCCMITPNISNSIHHHSGEESSYQKEILNKMLKIGFEKFSLKNKTLKEVFNNGVLHKFVYTDLESNNPLKMCKILCGKCN